MQLYSNYECIDIIFCLGKCDGNRNAAARLYRIRFPDRRHPDHKAVARIEQRSRETGSFAIVRPDAGRPRSKRNARMEDRILDHFDYNREDSTRNAG